MKSREKQQAANVHVEQVEDRWIVRVAGDKPQVFQCTTEAMARQLSSVLARPARARR